MLIFDLKRLKFEIRVLNFEPRELKDKHQSYTLCWQTLHDLTNGVDMGQTSLTNQHSPKSFFVSKVGVLNVFELPSKELGILQKSFKDFEIFLKIL